MTEHANGGNQANRELFPLLWDLCEGRLTQESAERLNDLLLADASCRRTFIEFMQTVAGLEWEHSGLGGQAMETATRGPLCNKAGVLGAAGQSPALRVRSGQHSFTVRWEDESLPEQDESRAPVQKWQPLVSLANWLQLDRIVSVSRAAAALVVMGTLCAGVLVAAAVTVAVMTASAQTKNVGLPTFVAKLTSAHQVEWADEATAVMVDQLLAEGQTLEVLSGWAEITFKSGARVVLEGPAKLEIHSGNSARLIEGKLATDKSARQIGFTVDTPSGRVVDMGAEFGVAVDANRTMEVDVFAGTAEVRPMIESATGALGPAERVSANQFVRAVGLSTKPESKATLERRTNSDNHFVRTMRSKAFTLGGQCIGRAERDLATGTVCFVRDPTTISGRPTTFSFYNVHADVDRWITPIILAFDRSTGTYRITGIGQSVLNLGSGLQTAPFQLVAGSADLEAGVHTFGFYHGTIDKTGRATSASYGPLDYDHVPESIEPESSLAAEARWVFVPGENTPVQLRLDLEFNMTPTSGQIPLWPGNHRFPRERVYSGRLEIVAEPEFTMLVRNRDWTTQTVQ